jgi:hypothetical protein
MWRGHEYEHNQFGDHGYEASCRRDFLGGLFYSGRREYLHENEKSNSLEPPNEFKTKKQMRNELKIKKSGGIDYTKIRDYSNQTGTNQYDQILNKKEKDNAKKLQNIQKRNSTLPTVIETFSSLDPKDWAQEFQAGVKMWVNHNTGEVSDVCPWEKSTFSSLASTNNNKKVVSEENDIFDTLDYEDENYQFENAEINEVFKSMDKLKSPTGRLSPQLSPVLTGNKSMKK